MIPSPLPPREAEASKLKVEPCGCFAADETSTFAHGGTAAIALSIERIPVVPTPQSSSALEGPVPMIAGTTRATTERTMSDRTRMHDGHRRVARAAQSEPGTPDQTSRRVSGG